MQPIQQKLSALRSEAGAPRAGGAKPPVPPAHIARSASAQAPGTRAHRELALAIDRWGRLQREASQALPPAGWRGEREARLQAICNGIAAHHAKGESLSRACAHFARLWNGKPFRCDPSRRWKLGTSTLLRLYGRWRRQGELPAAFRLGYVNPPKVEPALLVRFIQLAAQPSCRSLRDAFEILRRRWQRGGGVPGTPGRRWGRHRRPPAVSYATLARHFPRRRFDQLAALAALAEAAKKERARLLLAFVAEAEALPRPPKRAWRRRREDFAI
jgi:hypothetical protein